MRRSTIRDVAEKAGVGKVTASYVLSGQSKTARISADTEARVLKAAQELEYRPNAIARMLATQRTSIIAVVFLGVLVDSKDPNSVMLIGIGAGAVVIGLAAFTFATKKDGSKPGYDRE